jgi:hypothetical protein
MHAAGRGNLAVLRWWPDRPFARCAGDRGGGVVGRGPIAPTSGPSSSSPPPAAARSSTTPATRSPSSNSAGRRSSGPSASPPPAAPCRTCWTRSPAATTERNLAGHPPPIAQRRLSRSNAYQRMSTGGVSLYAGNQRQIPVPRLRASKVPQAAGRRPVPRRTDSPRTQPARALRRPPRALEKTGNPSYLGVTSSWAR